MENTNNGKGLVKPSEKFHKGNNAPVPSGMKATRQTGKNNAGTAYLQNHKSKVENSGQG